MKISHIEHLGIAVKSIEEALPYYENVLGLKCYNIETVEDQKVKTAFLKCGETKLELGRNHIKRKHFLIISYEYSKFTFGNMNPAM